MFWVLAVLYMAGSRIGARIFLQAHRAVNERAVIYGAGEAGARLASALVGSTETVAVAFVDDNPLLHRTVINGLAVHAPRELPELISGMAVSRVLLAMPSLSVRRKHQILRKLEPLGLHVQTVPAINDLASGRANVDEIREVDAAELLGRDPVPPRPELLSRCIRGKAVLVTGAGGSIGSELCRQIIELQPRRLVLLDNSEPALYKIEQEVLLKAQEAGIATEIVGLLGSVCRRQRIREILSIFQVQTVYHAAAYKHVPIVEENVIAGVDNNIFGTLRVAEESANAGVETFVLISTDKAVSPTNVMGATKRFAELVLQGLALHAHKTRYCMVRFGNVLDSSGSVVPLFREQIRRGGPVTVTHPEITRFFMTIPEAAQLVLHAGAMAEGGDVFLLEMGKPVKIADLARRMIKLTGMQVRDENNPEGDIEIEYIGLRPAEKLYEELLIDSDAVGTDHPRIMRAMEKSLPWTEVCRFLEQFRVCVDNMDADAARKILRMAVEEYAPKIKNQDLVWIERSRQAIIQSADVVTPIDKHRIQRGD
jgi:FlaA1/EpsC-like NDP-sugar epimerase